MDITFTSIVGLSLAAFYLWKNKRDEKRADKIREKIRIDNVLYRNIRIGKREYDWEVREDKFQYVDMYDKQIILENAHMIIYKVKHFADFRLGFYFKDIKEYGLYCNFDGYEMYYRTDSSFEKEDRLLYDEDESDE